MKIFWQAIPRPILALAPMVGVTDSAFRQLCKRWGAHVVYSEMISADALVHRADKAHQMMAHEAVELPLVVQLMGKDPAVVAKAARLAESAGASGIDLNFGCPAHKIARNMCGVMLMRDFPRSRSIIEAVMEAVAIPVSIKVRTSIKADRRSHDTAERDVTIIDFLKYVHDLPIAAIMVHGRSFEDSFEGGVRSEIIRSVKDVFTAGPVLANGGITSVESASDFLRQTTADGIGFARSAIGRPWIFTQVSEYLHSGSFEQPGWPTVCRTILEHVTLFEQARGRTPFQAIRRHLSHYVRGFAGASAVRSRLVQADSVRDVEVIVRDGQRAVLTA